MEREESSLLALHYSILTGVNTAIYLKSYVMFFIPIFSNFLKVVGLENNFYNYEKHTSSYRLQRSS